MNATAILPHHRAGEGASPPRPTHKGPRGLERRWAAASMPALALLGALTLSACEDKAIGRVCELQAEGDENQAIVNAQALECPTRVCLRPARDVTKAESIDTTSLCTAECSSDSDCDGAETRNSANTGDKRCKSGFVCGVASVTGSFCCKKLCMCKDFLTIPQSGLETPAACNRSVNPGACPLID